MENGNDLYKHANMYAMPRWLIGAILVGIFASLIMHNSVTMSFDGLLLFITGWFAYLNWKSQEKPRGKNGSIC